MKPSNNRQVLVTATSNSDQVSFVNEQHGNRIGLSAVSKRKGSNLADYIVLVPDDSVMTMQSFDEKLDAQGLGGDVILEGSTGVAQVSGAATAHVHIKTLSGPIAVSEIRHSSVVVNSVSGNISLHNVVESPVKVHSGSGRIAYDGDPGVTGDYALTSRTGDLDISIPASTPVEIKASSMKGESEQPVNAGQVPGTSQKSLFVNPGLVNAPRFVLRSFKGKIHLRRP